MEVVFLIFILVLSIFLGFELISKVPATLHTPLMSGSYAISAAMLQDTPCFSRTRKRQGSSKSPARLWSCCPWARGDSARGDIAKCLVTTHRLRLSWP